MNQANHLIGNVISASARLGLGYAERMLTDVSADQFARFATADGRVIESNHPCFILGHLSLYPSRVVSELGGDASAIQPTETFQKVFSKDAKCVDDPDGTLYPSMDEVVAAFRSGYEKAIDAVEQATDDQFVGENPNEAMRGKFPTIGAAHAFYLGGHVTLHMGQFSAWRRMMGLGPA
ncbi:hypothetical protein Enr13x_02420 [Stieleria neptunia]|uniref:DinB superfamily protein n=1 Tax=Stieleria neptunia TaxID=2527979 RepID=A0A518HHW0_9BACT|nr:DinB family protein [Stieleria neptunia]QDV40436.1 hypothetical protein Enr13x_02420 [Stieleria neptunia]